MGTMRKIFVIGIGAGDPEHITVQAINALTQVDVFFVVDKGAVKQDLVELREEILNRHVTPGTYRVVQCTDPERERTAEAYAGAVDDWRRRRADVCEEAIRDELGEDEVGAFLVWGDPSLYDSTLAIITDIRARAEVTFDYEVIPGISSVSALAAQHRTTLNQIGRPVQITTGRLLASGWPEGMEDVVVMLDARNAFQQVADDDTDIYWGAYVGTPDEILISGKVSEVAPRIEAERAEARRRKGWIMDSYLLRRDVGATGASDE